MMKDAVLLLFAFVPIGIAGKYLWGLQGEK